MKSELNFLPIKKRKKVRKPVSFRKICLIFFFIACIGFLISYQNLFRLNEICLSEIKSLEKLIQIKKEQRIPIDALAAESELLEFKEKILSKLSEGSEKNAFVLMTLQENIPNKTVLIDYLFEDDQVFFAGKTKRQSEIIEMQEALIQTQCFETVDILNSEKKTRDLVLDLNDLKPKEKEIYWEFAFSMKLTRG